MSVDRVKFQDIVESQFPRYVLEDFPLLPEFVKQYYKSQEYQGGTFDLIQNMDQYVKVDQLFSLKTSTQLGVDIDYTTTTIPTSSFTNFTEGFPETNGLIKIGNEIIHYESISNNSFINCTRGFSGITSYISPNTPDQLTFESSVADEHEQNDEIQNLNVIFLQEFFRKLKNLVVPGFNERDLYTGLDQRNFIFNADSFYKSRGTDESFKILFRALYGDDVEVIDPSQLLFRPSDANYLVTQDFIVEQVEGDPLELKNRTLFQERTNARGSVSNVQQINYDRGQFYQISIDYGYNRDVDVRGTIFGEFEVSSKTKLLNSVSIGSTIIDVDSTLGFPETGTLLVADSIGDEISIAYTGKSIDQFFNITGVDVELPKKTDVRISDVSYAYVSSDTSQKVEVRIASALKEFKLNEPSYGYNVGDRIRIQTLGIERGDERSNNWYNNTKTEWKVESVNLVDELEQQYFITLFDDHFLRNGYEIVVINTSGREIPGTIVQVNSSKSFTAKLNSFVGNQEIDRVENQILKGKSGKYPKLSDYTANLQNFYQDFENNVVIASNSIANYNEINTDPYNKKVTFSGTSESDGQTLKLLQNGDHGFNTGDAVFYSPGIIKETTTTPDGITNVVEIESKFEDVNANVYYIYRVDSLGIKLSRSRSDINSGKFVNLIGDVVDNEIVLFNFYQKEVEPQSIAREIKSPDNTSGTYPTPSGYSGILINGVEIVNYKSDDFINYGDLRSIEVVNGGQNYDVINPPILSIQDDVGTGATGKVAVEGQLVRFDIIDKGFDYVTTPIIRISGGNPKEEAVAEVNMSSIEHVVGFNAYLGGNDLSIDNNTIGFSTFHKFGMGERVVYDAIDGTPIGGITTLSSYYVGKIDNLNIQLHNTPDEARSGINTVDLTSFGGGVQYLKSVERKKVISSIVVTNPGSGYKNKERNIPLAGINTALNRFKITNHGYESNEVIKYSTDGVGIDGLSTNESYFVNKIDKDTFSLSLVGTGVTEEKYFVDNQIEVEITAKGSGTFNYKPIQVDVEGVIGVQTTTGQDFGCEVQPVFRGEVDSIDLTSFGSEYGSSEIVNFNRLPNVSFSSGYGAILTPVISGSKVVDIVINSGGKEYNSPPDLLIDGEGVGCELTPIIDNGSIVDVIIVSSGGGYESGSTNIIVKAAGEFGQTEPVIRSWNINRFERDFNNINDDDGFIDVSIDDTSLEYSHCYLPRPLRSNTYVKETDGSTAFGVEDLTLIGGKESTNVDHSPIFGWAYDGNPIYGPYGYTNPSGGGIKQMESGYETQIQENRPSISVFPLGYFVEDYIFTERGDLDEHNGRFCITPDFPDGTYCYFATVNTVNDTDGPFRNFRRPLFPYVIGNTFQSKPNSTNYKVSSNQSDYNFEDGVLFRNTESNHTNADNSGYDYFFNSNNERKQILNITSTSKGVVEQVAITTGGLSYKVNDKVDFNNSKSGGNGAEAKVFQVDGRLVNYIRNDSTVAENIEFGNLNNVSSLVGFSTQSIPFFSGDEVLLTGLSTNFSEYSGTLKGIVGLTTEKYVLTLGVGDVGVTGITTYFYVSGNLSHPNIRENDILVIGEEKVKVLNVDQLSRRIRVVREQESTTSAAYNNNVLLTEDPHKVRIDIGGISKNNNLGINREYYFIPDETIGTGSTVVFSDPGVGITQLFIPSQNVYIPDHGLKANDKLIYNPQGGTPIGVDNGISASTLDQFPFVYVAPVTKDLVGLATNRIGIGSDGTYVGIGTTTALLTFTSVPTDDYQSFLTDKTNVLTGNISKNIVTVATGTTHGLEVRDTVTISVKPTTTKTVSVIYDDYTRRIIFDPQTISSVDLVKNTINIPNHELKKGEKVLYRSSSPIGGMEIFRGYFVYPYDSNNIQLVEDLNEFLKTKPVTVDLTSSGDGTLSRINPPVSIFKNQKIKFDLSDSSLSFERAGNTYSSFEMRLYTDSLYTNYFTTTGENDDFEVVTTGRPGIDSDANLTITMTDEVPEKLWYKFCVINIDINTEVKKEIVVDTTVKSHSEIDVEKTRYDGRHSISGIGSTTFTYTVVNSPDVVEYDKSDSLIEYKTTSTNTDGPICSVIVTNGGYDYESVPGITSVVSSTGSGAILEPISESIGSIQVTDFDSTNIGWDYPTDTTVRIVSNPPEILELESLSSFESIGISSGGKNYLNPPRLVVIDGFTNEIIDDVDLKYNLGDPTVTILLNTTGMFNTTPRIIPVDNSNGVGISSVTYTSGTKTVRLDLDATFSDLFAFPYNVGSQILVENINIGVNTTGTGYNSEDYSYTFFTITNSDPKLGGSGAYLEYSLDEYLQEGDSPGIVDYSQSSGRVISTDDFPIFEPVLKKNDYFLHEVVTNQPETIQGRVSSWNNVSETLKVETPREFSLGDRVIGKTSKTQSIVIAKVDFNSEIITGAGTSIINGWQKNTGFLNDNLQRIPNNEYYQDFSYSISSRIPFDTWEDPVSSLNHISGFQKFSDLQVISKEDQSLSIVEPVDSDIDTTTDIISEYSVHCYPDFDEVSENFYYVNNQLFSNEIYFNNTILTDYFNSVGNRVLDIDDISDEFFSNERSTRYSNVAKFAANDKYNRILTFVRDRTYTDERQFGVVSILQHNSSGYVAQYASAETYPELGYFDYTASETGWDLQFYPTKTSFNIYDVSSVSISIKDNITGVGSTAIGDIIDIRGVSEPVTSGSSVDILSVPTGQFRSARVTALVETLNNEFTAHEINLIHDGTESYMMEYGNLTNSSGPAYLEGFGEFTSSLSGGNIVLNYTANEDVTINCNVISISDTNTGIGTLNLASGRLSGKSKNISASATPTAETVLSFEEPYGSGYYIVQVTDTTNNNYELFEVATIVSHSNEVFVEWANMPTNDSLGQVGVSSTGNYKNLTYTPNENIDVEIKVFSIEQQIANDSDGYAPNLDLENNQIIAEGGNYTGTKLDLRDSFELTHQDIPIFRKDFDGTSSIIVDTDLNVINFGEHFFVTGEQVKYSYEGDGQFAIGIAETTITGIGLTNKLPQDLFVVTVNDGTVRFAESAENALKTNPIVFEFSTVGGGTSHSVTSTNQNHKALIAIDNMIQSPLSNTKIVTNLTEDINTDSNFGTTGITSFKAADLIQIGGEVMRIISTNTGGVNFITVLREQLGTAIESHSAGATITKLTGTYNITDSTINFVSAPYGAVPLSTTTGDPNQRDYTGLTTHSTFQGRTFMRTAPVNSTRETYSTNFVFDDISDQFTGFTSSFNLTQDNSNTTGFSTDNGIILINNIFQEPKGVQADQGNYDIVETSGISSITFTDTGLITGYDPNKTSLPIGGVIVSVASSGGLGYQPLLTAGGVASVSPGGTIQSISIGNSGSGYRSGIQTVVNVGVQTYSTGVPNIELVGTATISGGHIVSIAITNPGSGYDSSNPPEVIIDDPLPYDNIPLIYSSSGSGVNATANIKIGVGGSMIDYVIQRGGYSYGNSEILTVSVGGTTGIPVSDTYSELQFTVLDTYSDSFNGMSVGVLDVLDNFNEDFNGVNKTFNLKKNGIPLSIQSEPGSKVEVDKTLLIFINDVLQQPEVAYFFNGGSSVQFVDAPGEGDTSKVLFYKGSGDIDVVFTDIVEPIKVGDTLNIDNDPAKGQGINLDEDSRTVVGINTIDTVETNAYSGPGITTDTTLLRPVTHCKQIIDKIINGKEVGKDRVEYEPQIYPTSYLIQPVSTSSTFAYVDSVRPLYNTFIESNSRDFQNKIRIVSQDSLVSASATATVSGLGTVSVEITNTGVGYTVAPVISISKSPDGTRATAVVSELNSGVGVVTITNPGTGYTTSNPPQVLFNQPKLISEDIEISSYTGDYGVIVGLAGDKRQLTFDFYIPVNSFMKDSTYVGSAVTVSGISAGDFFTVSNSNVDLGTLTSLETDDSTVIGVTTSFCDSVYQVASVSLVETNVIGVGNTLVARVVTNISATSNPSGGGSSPNMGEYSWGKINFSGRPAPFDFNFYGDNGLSGISTSGLVSRFQPLKFTDYIS